MLQDKYLFLAEMMQILNKHKQTCPQFFAASSVKCQG